MSFYDEVVSNPWLAAYKCAQRKCDLSEAGRILGELLSKPMGSREYFIGLEFLKALKSQLRIEDFLTVLRKGISRELIEKLLRDTEPSKILELYRENYLGAMGLLTVLELYPLAGLTNELLDRIVKLIMEAPKKFKGKDLIDFCRALIYGPIATLPMDKLVVLIDKVLELPSTPECLIVKADLATMIPDVYPPKVLQENPLIAEKIGILLRDIAENTLLLLEEDPDRALDIYSELSLFQTRMNNICRSLNDWSLCKTVSEKAGETLLRMFEAVGKLYIATNQGGFDQ